MNTSTSFNTSFCDVTEFENLMALDNPIKSTTPRWERKARQAQQQQLQASQADRYIPNRSGMDFDLNQKNSLNDENFDMKADDLGESTSSEHARLLLANTKDSGSGGHKPSEGKGARVLAFKNKAPAPADGYQNSLKVLYSTQSTKKDMAKPTRHIASAPVRILDAPDMLDDYCKLGRMHILNIYKPQLFYNINFH